MKSFRKQLKQLAILTLFLLIALSTIASVSAYQFSAINFEPETVYTLEKKWPFVLNLDNFKEKGITFLGLYSEDKSLVDYSVNQKENFIIFYPKKKGTQLFNLLFLDTSSQKTAGTKTKPLTINVMRLNKAPKSINYIPTIVFNNKLAFNLNNYFYDPDYDKLSYSFETKKDLFSITIDENGKMEITPNPEKLGKIPIPSFKQEVTITAKDPYGYKVSREVTFELPFYQNSDGKSKKPLNSEKNENYIKEFTFLI